MELFNLTFLRHRNAICFFFTPNEKIYFETSQQLMHVLLESEVDPILLSEEAGGF